MKQGAKLGVALTMCLAEIIGILFFLLAPYLIALFSDTPEVVAYGIRQARVESLFYCLLALSHACAAVLRGAGRTIVPMAVMLAIWCVGRITYITAMVRLIPNITVVFTAYPVTWFLSSVLFVVTLLRGRWLEQYL